MSEERQESATPPRGPNRPRKGDSHLLVSVLVLFLTFGLFVGAARWFLERGVVFGVTPTITPTRKAATPTDTPDFRATQNAVEMATQRAQQLALLGVDTPTPDFTPTPTPTLSPTPTLIGVPPPGEPMTEPFLIPLPLVGAPGSISTPAPTAVLTETPTIPDPTPSPLQTPTQPIESIETPEETPTNTPTATATAQPPVVLQALTRFDTAVHMGPSSLYTQTIVLPAQERLLLRGRDVTGEWIYLCCEHNIEGWTRQVNLELHDNQIPAGAPSNANPNDVRWLLERPASVALPNPPPTPTQIPPDDFPLYRRNPAAQAQVDRPLATTYRSDWLRAAQASRAMSSSVIVVGPSVMVASEDLHLYSFDRETGHQRWRYQFDQIVRQPVAVQDSIIYAVDVNGTVYALQDQGNRHADVWKTSIPTAPSAPINLWGNILLVPGADHRLYALDRLTRASLWDVEIPGGRLQYPAVGGQLVFAGNASLHALDIYDPAHSIWEDTRFASVAAPPVYSQPGVLALAEVYAADGNGSIHAIDANTGQPLWSHHGVERTDSMALDRSTLYASGSGFVKAVDRRNGQQIWRYAFGDRIVGGPIVGEGRILFASESGAVQVLDAISGTLLFNTGIPSRVAGAPAVSGERIFVPSTDANLYALREAN